MALTGSAKRVIKSRVDYDRTGHVAQGWVYEDNDPHTAQDVEVLIDGRFAARVRADLMSMGRAGPSPEASFNAFEYVVPRSIRADGRLHFLEFKTLSGVDLHDAPILIDDLAPSPDLGPQFRLSDREAAVRLGRADDRGSGDRVSFDPLEPFVSPTGALTSNTLETGGLWGHKVYQPWRPYTARLTDVYVDPLHGTIFNAAGELWAGCHYLRNTDAIRAARTRILDGAADVPHVAGEALLFGESVLNNYWHWHADCLPALLQEAGAGGSPARALSPPLNAWQRLSAEILLRRPLTPTKETLLHVDAVRVTSYMDGRSIYPDAGVMAVFATIRAAVEAETGSSVWTPERVFVSRRDATDRVLENEEELSAALAQLDFTTVRLAETDYLDQVMLFANARVVVGSHGAGLTNVGFCHPGASVVEIVPASRAIGAFRFLAARTGLNHHWYAVDDAEAVRLDVDRFMADLLPIVARHETKRS